MKGAVVKRLGSTYAADSLDVRPTTLAACLSNNFFCSVSSFSTDSCATSFELVISTNCKEGKIDTKPI